MAARREQRILLAEAKAKAVPAVIEQQAVPVSAEEILIGLLNDVRNTLTQLKQEMATNPSPTMMMLLADWFDRCDRISRTVLITNAQDRLEVRRQQLAKTTADQLLTLIFVSITSVDMAASTRVAILDALFAAMDDPDFTVVPASDISRWLAKTRAEARAEAAPVIDDGPVLAALDFAGSAA